ncbi:hypothetical protein [Piscinibacter sp. HJYY11]|uniref:hypothetical protein n=1 Tax=Piscinibacter sp. HJYY11 TaxID=2801333 RepID=UPI00191F8333|nr:hypothetical protein [Piscinibacter sp. HJYY11]MBL0729449.1 hypothetical protein [Piscinibacter sp. HJYY11]
MNQELIALHVRNFIETYPAAEKDAAWRELTQRFRWFWKGRVLQADGQPLSDAECDEVIRTLDRNAKGNTKASEAVAKAMVPQGAWRRMLNEFHTNATLGGLMDRVLSETDASSKARLIDELYIANAGQKNNLTGPSGNAIGAYLAAFDPVANLSIISLKDRRAIIDYFGFVNEIDWDGPSIGHRIVESNRVIIEGSKSFGLTGSARTISRFYYQAEVKALWRGEHSVRLPGRTVSVAVPPVTDELEEAPADSEVVRESMQVQGLLARIGTMMNFSIWLPKADRSRVLKVWKPEPGELIDELPLGYDPSTIKTIEQIDVLWLRKRSIVRAFEVEHTTSVYSGLLRMADLVALQPNINIKLHIVAPADRQEKVLQEIRRPVFSLLEGRELAQMCTFLSYDSIREIGELKHLEHLSDKILEEYQDIAGTDH